MVGDSSGGMIVNAGGEGVGIYCSVQQILELLCGDNEGRALPMILGRYRHLGHLLTMRTVFPLLFGVIYFLQSRLKLCLFVCLGLCGTDVSWWSVSDLILDLIHSIIVIIDLIPHFRHLYFRKTFLDTLETTITVIVAPIMMMMMSVVCYVRNVSRKWALSMMRLSVKTLNLSQCPTLPVTPNSFSSLLVSESMAAKELSTGMVSGHCWLELWDEFTSALSLHYLV